MENWFTQFGTEFLGSLLLILLGNGVVANTIFKECKGHKQPFTSIMLGWGFAVAIGALVSSALGGKAHLNPAVTFTFVVNHWTQNVGPWGLLPIIIVAQALGFFVGQILVDLVYFQQIKTYFKSTADAFETNATQAVLSMHATVPQTRVIWSNFLMEFLGTAVLVLVILTIPRLGVGLPLFFGPLIVMLVVMAVGCSLSGTTGYAINPFRDLIPRIVYQVLIFWPFANKKVESADWKYSWIPVLAPLSAGAVVGACFLI